MMSFQNVPAAIPIGFAAALSGALALFAWRRRAMPMAPAFAVMMAGETAWALGAALEPMVIDLAIKRLCIDLRLLGTLTALLGLLAFVLRYTGRLAWLDVRRFGLIAAPGILLVGLAWTDRWHHLYWTRLSNEKLGESWIAIRSFGPGFWAFFAYGYALVAVSTVLLGQAVVRSTGLYRAQAALMLFGVLLPWVVEIADMSHLFGFIPVDLVSMTFAVTGLTFLPALFRFRLLDLTPVAWAEVVERHGRSGLRPGSRRADRRSEPGRAEADRRLARDHRGRGGRARSRDGPPWRIAWLTRRPTSSVSSSRARVLSRTPSSMRGFHRWAETSIHSAGSWSCATSRG